MELKRLKLAMRDAGTQLKLLRGYQGRASVGIESDPDDATAFAVVVHVQPKTQWQFPAEVNVGDEAIKVVVVRDFAVPILN